MKHKENDCLELNLILKHKGTFGICHVPSWVCSELCWLHHSFCHVSTRACADKRGGGEKSEPLLLTTSCYTWDIHSGTSNREIIMLACELPQLKLQLLLVKSSISSVTSKSSCCLLIESQLFSGFSICIYMYIYKLPHICCIAGIDHHVLLVESC
jgi:hypothetical protein